MPSNPRTMTRRFPLKPLAALLMLTPCVTVTATETTADTLVITARHWQEDARQFMRGCGNRFGRSKACSLPSIKCAQCTLGVG